MISYEKLMEKLMDGKYDSLYDVPEKGGWLEIINNSNGKKEIVYVKAMTQETWNELKSVQ